MKLVYLKGVRINTKKIMWLITLISIFILVNLSSINAAQITWQDVANSVKTDLNKALNAYRSGDTKRAVQLVDDAYFGEFETQGMEAAIGQAISIKRVYQVEGMFRTVKSEMKSGGSHMTVLQEIEKLKGMLDEDANVLDGGAKKSPYAMLIASFLIIFREGIEAILVIGAIAAYLIKSGNKDKVRSIYYGVGMAVILSIASWAVITQFFKSAGYTVELIEGITLLLAMAVLFTVSYWLLSKAQAQVWQKYIQNKVVVSLTKGSMFALASAGFLAVYREGAEIVLFYQALAARASSIYDTRMLIVGFVAGIAVLVAFYIVYRFGSVKIPIKQFFIATGLLLYLLSFIFAGEAINKLQIAGIVGSTGIKYVPVIGTLGIYPTLQSLAIQLVLVLALVSAFIYQRLKIEKS